MYCTQGSFDRITIHLIDYQSMLPEWKGVFDRIISIKILEYTRKEYFNIYWKIVDWALKPQTRAGIVQVITILEASIYGLFFFSSIFGMSKTTSQGQNQYNKEIDFVQKWVCSSS